MKEKLKNRITEAVKNNEKIGIFCNDFKEVLAFRGEILREFGKDIFIKNVFIHSREIMFKGIKNIYDLQGNEIKL